MKKLLCLCTIIIMTLTITSCGKANGGENSNVKVMGAFIMEPLEDDIYDFSDGLDEGEVYCFVVIDIMPDSEKNIHVDVSDIKFNDTNKYDMWGLGYNCNEFIKRSGYLDGDDIDEIAGGSEPARTILAYIINKNDINGDMTAEFEVTSDTFSESINLKKEDFEIINLMDEVFKVEENYEGYQISRSVYARTEQNNSWIRSITKFLQGYNEFDVDTVVVFTQWAEENFSSEADYTFASTGEMLLDNQLLPTYDIEKLRNVNPDLAKLAEEYKKNSDIVLDCLTDENPWSQAEVNELSTNYNNSLNAIYDYFNK